jgi:hypothetical protein
MLLLTSRHKKVNTVKIIVFKIFLRLTSDDKNTIQKYIPFLCDPGTRDRISNTISKIYLSIEYYDYGSLCEFYTFLTHYKNLKIAEALELLLPR